MPYSSISGGSSNWLKTTDFDSVNGRSTRSPLATPRQPKCTRKESRLLRSNFSPDGFRFIANAYAWTMMRHVLAHMNDEKCERCGNPAPIKAKEYWPVGEADHIYGRGGGKREDRIIVVKRDENGNIIDVIRYLQWLCLWCHRKKHNQM